MRHTVVKISKLALKAKELKLSFGKDSVKLLWNHQTTAGVYKNNVFLR